MAVATKSPFFIVQDFISPMMCEDLVDTLEFTVPDVDKDDHSIPTYKTHELAERVVYERFLQLVPQLEEYYGIDYKGTERVQFEWFAQGSEGEMHAENSSYLRKKWLRTKQRDLTAVLFLSDYQEQASFDAEFEVYGGKLEFPQHNRSINPQRGTLVVFPSDPHFINRTSGVFIGDLYQARIQLAAKTPFIYQPQGFPGDYRTWFKAIV